MSPEFAPDMLQGVLWQVVLLLAGGLLTLILLQPALDEWAAHHNDEAPPDPDTAPPDQLTNLRRLAREEFGDMLRRVNETGGVARGIDLEGEPVLMLGPKEVLAAQIEPGTSRIRFGVLATQRLDVPGELVCERDLYAEGRASIAQNAIVRNLLGLRDVVVGVRARVTHQIHADGRLDVAEGGWLHGTASAGMAITLSRRSRFTRIEAPLIEFGPHVAMPARPSGQLPEFIPPRALRDANGKRWLVRGDLTIPAGHRVNGDLVVSGRLLVLENSELSGSVRAEKSVRLSRGARIDGAVISPSDIRLAEDCRVGGPLLAGTRLQLAEGCVVGSRSHPTSITAAKLRVATGCVAFGSVSTRHGGQVLAPQELQA